jgi:signal peptidase I
VDEAPIEPAAPATGAAPAVAADAPVGSGTPVEGKASARPLGWLIELAKTIALTLIIFFAVQTFVAQPFQVQMYSMERTFEPGDYVLVDKLSVRWDGYSRGDVVVFHPPENVTADAEPYIKRVIGEPGDTVELRDGLVYVNGVELQEPYLYTGEDGLPQPTDPADEDSWVIPDGYLFVMGDHREASADSRVFGPIAIDSVIGRGALRYWPLGKIGFITAPTYEGIPAPAP